jgi:hypothetical protein
MAIFGCGDGIASVERRSQRGLVGGGEGVGGGDTDAAKVLRLEPKGAAAHLHAIGRNECLSNLGQQQPAEHPQVPLVGDDVVQVVVRVETARFQYWVGGHLQVGEEQLRAFDQRVVNLVDGAVPLVGSLAGHVAIAQHAAVQIEVFGEPWIPIEVDQGPVLLPRVH